MFPSVMSVFYSVSRNNEQASFFRCDSISWTVHLSWLTENGDRPFLKFSSSLTVCLVFFPTDSMYSSVCPFARLSFCPSKSAKTQFRLAHLWTDSQSCYVEKNTVVGLIGIQLHVAETLRLWADWMAMQRQPKLGSARLGIPTAQPNTHTVGRRRCPRPFFGLESKTNPSKNTQRVTLSRFWYIVSTYPHAFAHT